jgi:lipopolysaccharide/colanic/teichoic acid biosynthesis glycosyltransferase
MRLRTDRARGSRDAVLGDGADVSCGSSSGSGALAVSMLDLRVAPSRGHRQAPAGGLVPSARGQTPTQRSTARSRRAWKSVMDPVIAAVLLIVLTPIGLAVAAVVLLTSGAPVLYRQTRVGLGGRPFVCLKFRTMRRTAEAELAGLLPHNEHDGLLFKIREDPRVTRTGRFLRRWSLDELPQLVNVLRGDMSMVGPRPALPNEVDRFETDLLRRLHVKPGLTGLCQVNGRADLPWEDAVRYDLEYVDRWSPWLDVKIIFRTVGAVLRRTGAY